MDISTDKHNSDLNHSSPFSALLHTVLSIGRWLIGFFALTKEDRLKAGVYLDNVGHGE